MGLEKFDLKNIKNSKDYNFYNYNTNSHRHICEIKQELMKHANYQTLYFHLTLISFLILEACYQLCIVIYYQV